MTDADSIGMADVGAVTSDGEDEVALLRELPTPGACIFDGGSSTTPHYDDALVPIGTTSVAVEALGDIDGSGGERFAIIANTEGRVELYTSTDTGTVPVPDLVVSSTASFAPDAAGGLGGDGVQDLLVGDDSFGCSTTCGAIWVFVGPTTGDLDLAGAGVVLAGPADTKSGGAVGGFGFDLEAGGDLDGDADLIVPALANEHLPLFTGPFAGTIDLATDEPVARRTGSAAGTGAVGDVDADGDGELAVLCWDDPPIWVLYIVAGGSSSWPTTPVQRAARAPSGLEWLVAPPPDPCHSELRVFRPMPPRNAFSECTRVHGHE